MFNSPHFQNYNFCWQKIVSATLCMPEIEIPPWLEVVREGRSSGKLSG